MNKQFIIDKISEFLGKQITKYDWVGDFKNGFAQVIKIIEGERKYGFINKEGKEVVPCVYDNVYDFSDGFAEVQKDGVWYKINTKGEIVN